MRQQTRRKYYGRTAVAQALRTASAELARAVEISEKPAADPLLDSLKKVATSVARAVEAEKVYILGRKRIAGKLARQQRAIDDLIKEVQGIPVMPEEKTTARRDRARERQQRKEKA